MTIDPIEWLTKVRDARLPPDAVRLAEAIVAKYSVTLQAAALPMAHWEKLLGWSRQIVDKAVGYLEGAELLDVEHRTVMESPIWRLRAGPDRRLARSGTPRSFVEADLDRPRHKAMKG
jgi:hypothetical protein